METKESRAAELKLLKEERSMLKERIASLEQLCLADVSPFKLGDVVQWGRQCRRGVVIAYEDWIGEATLVVTAIRKDGSYGDQHRVRPYDKPVAAKA